MLTAKRTISLMVIVVLLSAVIALISRQYRANLLYVPVQNQIDRWAESTTKPTKEQWQQALVAIKQAVELQPLMADYQLTNAKVLEWGWYLQYAEAAELAALPSLYQSAQLRRPRWAQAYADEAWFWFFIGGQPQKSTVLLQQAYRLGPFVPEVLFRGLTIQLQRWPQLTISERAAVLLQLKTLFLTDMRRRTIQLIQLNKRQKVACLYLRQQKDFPASLLREANKQFCEVQS